MILVMGGFASGEKEYVQNQWGYQPEDFACEITTKPVVCDLQNMDCSSVETLLPQLLEKEIVICNEMGCGLVPMDKQERAHRENVGRLCVALAKKAEEVHRVYSGIGSQIK